MRRRATAFRTTCIDNRGGRQRPAAGRGGGVQPGRRRQVAEGRSEGDAADREPPSIADAECRRPGVADRAATPPTGRLPGLGAERAERLGADRPCHPHRPAGANADRRNGGRRSRCSCRPARRMVDVPNVVGSDAGRRRARRCSKRASRSSCPSSPRTTRRTTVGWPRTPPGRRPKRRRATAVTLTVGKFPP